MNKRVEFHSTVNHVSIERTNEGIIANNRTRMVNGDEKG